MNRCGQKPLDGIGGRCTRMPHSTGPCAHPAHEESWKRRANRWLLDQWFDGGTIRLGIAKAVWCIADTRGWWS